MNPNQDLAAVLSADAYYQLTHDLHGSLPPPEFDTPEDYRRRDNAAIAQVAALQPANHAEAKLAAQFVAASAQGTDALRLVQLHADNFETASKCRAQAASMMRQANAAVRVLLLLQAARRKVEAHHETCDRGARAEHITGILMAEALDPAPAAPIDPAEETVITPPTQMPPPVEALISPHDPKTPKQKTETPPRHVAPKSRESRIRFENPDAGRLSRSALGPLPWPDDRAMPPG